MDAFRVFSHGFVTLAVDVHDILNASAHSKSGGVSNQITISTRRDVCPKTQCERVKRTLFSFSRVAVEIESLFDGIDFTLSCCRKFGLRSGKCLSDNRIDERNVHDVVLVGGSTRIKFLATGTFHGVGGRVCFDTHRNRFANELGRRDYVTGEMFRRSVSL